MHYHVYLDYNAEGGHDIVRGRWRLMTSVPDLRERLVGQDGKVTLSSRYSICRVVVPAWMEVLEFEAWAEDHRLMSIYGVDNAWDRQTWDQLRKLHDAQNHISRYLFNAATYLQHAKLRSAARIALRDELETWIASGKSIEHLFPEVGWQELGALCQGGHRHFNANKEGIWDYVGPVDWGAWSRTIEAVQPDLDRAALRMRRLVSVAQARRVRYGPKPIVTTEDDLAALSDVF